MKGMHLGLPFLLCVIAASLHYSTEAERFSNSRYLLGKALLRRAREIKETKNNSDVLEDEMSEEEREKVLQTDALEDIFVGSGNHVYESQGKSETSGSRRTSTSEESEAEETEENDSSPTSGDSNAGERSENDESDEDEDEKSEDDDDDERAETKKDQESQETTNDEDTSGSGLIESENISGSGSGTEQQNDDTEQSGSGESTIEEVAPAAAAQVEASGTEENASRKSEIETASGNSEDEVEESGSADVIKKGIESLSRLLTPIASGYDFELYSGNTEKNDKEEETEAEGESEKGASSDAEEVHVKQCKRVCEDPMSYEQCAVPRCDYKMGTIKDLCIYLCKHQTPVCRQQCE